MSGVVRALVCACLVTSSGLARAETTAAKKAPPKPPPAAPSSVAASPSDTPSDSNSASASDSSSTPSDSSSASASDSSSTNAPPVAPAPPTVRVFMRSSDDPLVFSARARNSDGTPTLCSTPCDAKLLPGDYQLRLNGVAVDGSVKLAKPGTLQGKFESREAGRQAAWLGLNVGGIIGGVFITVAALGGPSWAYIAGGGSLLSGGAIFALTYRSDRATVSFSPGEPLDMRGLPPPIPAQDNSSGPTPNAGLDRPSRAFGAQARGLGFRITF